MRSSSSQKSWRERVLLPPPPPADIIRRRTEILASDGGTTCLIPGGGSFTSPLMGDGRLHFLLFRVINTMICLWWPIGKKRDPPKMAKLATLY